MSNIEYRPVIKFLTRKGLSATEIRKELKSIYEDDTPSLSLAQFKHPKRDFEHSPRAGPTSTITTHQNILVLRRIRIRDRRISLPTN